MFYKDKIKGRANVLLISIVHSLSYWYPVSSISPPPQPRQQSSSPAPVQPAQTWLSVPQVPASSGNPNSRIPRAFPLDARSGDVDRLDRCDYTCGSHHPHRVHVTRKTVALKWNELIGGGTLVHSGQAAAGRDLRTSLPRTTSLNGWDTPQFLSGSITKSPTVGSSDGLPLTTVASRAVLYSRQRIPSASFILELQIRTQKLSRRPWLRKRSPPFVSVWWLRRRRLPVTANLNQLFHARILLWRSWFGLRFHRGEGLGGRGCARGKGVELRWWIF
jgi:hypothetical protein